MGDNKESIERGWESWGNYVLKTLEKLEEKVDILESKISENNLEANKDLVELKVKVGVVAAIAGIIASGVTSIIVGLFIYYVTTKKPDVEPPKSNNAYIEHVISNKGVNS